MEIYKDTLEEWGVRPPEADYDIQPYLDRLSSYFRPLKKNQEKQFLGVRSWDSFYDAVIDNQLWFRDSIHVRFSYHFKKVLDNIQVALNSQIFNNVDRLTHSPKSLVAVVRLVDTLSDNGWISQGIVLSHEMLRMILSIIIEKSGWKDEITEWDHIPFAIQKVVRSWEIPPFRLFTNPQFCENLLVEEEAFLKEDKTEWWKQTILFDANLLMINNTPSDEISLKDLGRMIEWKYLDDSSIETPSEHADDDDDDILYDDDAQSSEMDSICSDITNHFYTTVFERDSNVRMIRKDGASLHLPNARIIHPFILSLSVYMMAEGFAKYMHSLGDGSATSTGVHEDYAYMSCPNLVYMQIREFLRNGKFLGSIPKTFDKQTRMAELLLEYIYLMMQVLVHGEASKKIQLPHQGYASKILYPKKKRMEKNILDTSRQRQICERFHDLLSKVFPQAATHLKSSQLKTHSNKLSVARITRILTVGEVMDEYTHGSMPDIFWLMYHLRQKEDRSYLLIQISNATSLSVQETLARYQNKQLISDYVGFIPDTEDTVWCYISPIDFDFLVACVFPPLLQQHTTRIQKIEEDYFGRERSRKMDTQAIIHQNMIENLQLKRILGGNLCKINAEGKKVLAETDEEYWYRQLVRKRKLSKIVYEDHLSHVDRLADLQKMKQADDERYMPKMKVEMMKMNLAKTPSSAMIEQLYHLETKKMPPGPIRDAAMRENPYKMKKYHVTDISLICNMSRAARLDYDRNQILDGKYQLNGPPAGDHLQVTNWENLSSVFLQSSSSSWHILFAMKRIISLFSRAKQFPRGGGSPRMLYGRFSLSQKQQKQPQLDDDFGGSDLGEEDDDYETLCEKGRKLQRFVPVSYLVRNIYSQRRRCHSLFPDPRIPLELRILTQMHAILPRILNNMYHEETNGKKEEDIWFDLINPLRQLNTLQVSDVQLSINEMGKKLDEMDTKEEKVPKIIGFCPPEQTSNLYTSISSFCHLFSSRHLIHQSALFAFVDWIQNHPDIHTQIMQDPQLTLGWMLLLKMAQAYFKKDRGPDFLQIASRDYYIPIPNSPFVAYTGYTCKDFFVERDLPKDPTLQSQALLSLIQQVNRDGELQTFDDSVVTLTEDLELLEMPPVFHIYHLLALESIAGADGGAGLIRKVFLNIRCKYFRAKNPIYFPTSPILKHTLDYWKTQAALKRELSSTCHREILKEEIKLHPLEFMVAGMEFLSHFPYAFSRDETFHEPLYRGNLQLNDLKAILYRNPKQMLRMERGSLTQTQIYFPLYESSVIPPHLNPLIQTRHPKKMASRLFHEKSLQEKLTREEVEELNENINEVKITKGYFYFVYANSQLPRPFSGMDMDMFQLCLLFPCDEIIYSN